MQTYLCLVPYKSNFMKKTIILGIIACLLCTANQGFAQEIFSDIFNKIVVKTTPQYEKAKIQWATTKYDFGNISRYETTVYEFQFTNTSTIPVKITNAHSSSDCVVPSWENKAIPPNEMATIRVLFCAGQTGEFNKIIKVYFEDTKQAEALYIEGVVNDSLKF